MKIKDNFHASVRRILTAFTLTELLVVIMILMVLLGLGVGIARHILNQAAIARAKAEIRVISLALEAYRADYGKFPVNPVAFTTTSGTSDYAAAAGENSTALYRALYFDSISKGTKRYHSFKLEQLNTASSSVPDAQIIDPWGRPYNYDSVSPLDVRRNATFDLWSSGRDGQTGNRRRNFSDSTDPDNDDVTNFNE